MSFFRRGNLRRSVSEELPTVYHTVHGTGADTTRKKMFFKSLSVSIGSDGDNISVSSKKGVKQLVRKNSLMSLGIFAAAMKAKVIYLLLTKWHLRSYLN